MIFIDEALHEGAKPKISKGDKSVDFLVSPGKFGLVLSFFNSVGNSDIVWANGNTIFRDCRFEHIYNMEGVSTMTFKYARLDKQPIERPK